MTQTQRRTLGPDAVGIELPATQFEYTDRDVMLYALGVGATELDFVYERSLKALPTFAVIPAFPAMMGMSAGIEINLVKPAVLTSIARAFFPRVYRRTMAANSASPAAGERAQARR